MAFWGKVAQRTRVPAGTLLGAVFIVLMHPSVKSLWVGSFIALGGALLRLWAAGHIDKGKALTQGGPYAFTRNPLYLGSFFMAFGIIVSGRDYRLLLAFGIFFLLFYYPVMRAEELELLNGYGERFIEYSRKVPLFFPSLRASVKGSSTFLWSRVIKNREHRTMVGFLVAEILLILLRSS